MQKKKLRLVAAAAAALVMSMAAPGVMAQGSVPVQAAENGRLWFVELAGKPVADGNARSAVQAEKAAFRQAARAMGISYKERYSYDVLFNGFAVEVAPGQRAALARIAGVKAMYPVEVVQGPTPEQREQIRADLATALAMTGANVAQNSLGLTGAGIKVGVIDTGIDIDHPAFGGSGSNGTTPFPSPRVAYGYDFVGDAYNADPSSPAFNPVPTPDPNPDDCGGHGTHVAGIVGANGGGLTGVAPGVTFGAYRVFGCAGSTSSDIIVAALERAYADGMQIVNQSLGAARQWPQYPTAQATSRLVDKGVVMVASIGNNGPGGGSPDALFAAGAPGVGEKVIGVASYDNTSVTLSQFLISPDNTAIGFNAATGAPLPPTSGTGALARTGTATTANDACNAVAPAPGSLTGKIALIRRGTCSFYEKAFNAQAAGAIGVVLYNNAPGRINPTVAGTPAITIPVAAVSDTEGVLINNRLASGPVDLTWTNQVGSFPSPTGGLISGFSSFGLAADLSLKPNIGAPGGSIYSAYPLEAGGYATLSGTSMSAPHVAGGIALIKQARPEIPATKMMAHIQNTADPKNWSGNPGSGFLDFVHRQGAGMMDIVATVQSKALVEPSQIALGESEAGPKTVRITVKNDAAGAVTYDLSHVAALATGPNNTCGATCPASFNTTGTFLAPATVSLNAASITVPGKGSASFDVTIDANAALANRGIYGGYVTLTPQGGGETLRVPYAGLKGDYQSTPVLTPTTNGFPWLAKLQGTSLFNQPDGASYAMAGDDIPYFLLHFDHHVQKLEFTVVKAADGKPVHPVFSKTDVFEYLGRNSTPGGFFTFTWDGTRMHDNGKGTPDHRKVVPNGQYRIVIRALKPLGDEKNPAHWETWTSPTITVARP
ncbi:MAG: S8 family serine peptidase [Rubrivivax sp.]|nr:S8 family serine peptidase [Rubrivivax sp.]